MAEHDYRMSGAMKGHRDEPGAVSGLYPHQHVVFALRLSGTQCLAHLG